MKAKTITLWGIIAAIISLLGLETWTLANDQKEDTISEVIQTHAYKRIFIPFLFGFLMGHWFWPLDVRRKNAARRFSS